MRHKPRRFLISVLFTLWSLGFVVSDGYAQDDPYWAIEESFALSPEPYQGRYTVVAFIPRTFLLFDIDTEEPPDDILRRPYAAATTQDGVRVYMLEAAISEHPFTDWRGDQDLIFNTRIDVCRSSICDLGNDDDTFAINAGEAFVKHQVNEQLFRLEGIRMVGAATQKVEGFISKSRLADLNERAIVTRMDLAQPRYDIQKYVSKELSLGCDEQYNVGDEQITRALSKEDEVIRDAFGIASVSGDGNTVTLRFEKNIGGSDQAIEYRHYTINDNSIDAAGGTEKPTVQHIAMQIEIECEQVGAELDKIRYTSVVAWNATKGIRYGPYSPEGTPTNLKPYTKAPYLYSINNARQYKDLMETLGESIRDRAIAGYFLSEFNRSCNGEARKSEICASHSYR